MQGNGGSAAAAQRYQCPACGARFADILVGLEHTETTAGNVPLRRVA
ncbi:hypothetical protein [Halobaculum lipolyticum]|uniref:C2H2-type domain-containing protein n=1 Tax=Halobaculum lipolyticum TaxID=3032001 RepID=A0ABD5WEN9_9EURY|nr:hypothetical protein [Halobaculum sp. DT31]